MEDLVGIDPTLPFGVVCNDAGGANQIISMLKSWKWTPSFARIEGPALDLWRVALPELCPITDDFSWLDRVSFLITGTGWASNLEYNARYHAKQIGLTTIAVLDHWINYAERFCRNGEVVLPDVLWVVDSYAEELAKKKFPQIPVFLKPDCYGKNQADMVAPIKDSTPNNLLYLLEPIRSDWGGEEPGEYQALRYFLKKLPSIGLPNGTAINLRCHPSESPQKYAAFLEETQDFHVRMILGTLADALSASRWVAGCQTYAMTVALRAGRRVFCALPPWAPVCVLPHQGIEHLKDFVPL